MCWVCDCFCAECEFDGKPSQQLENGEIGHTIAQRELGECGRQHAVVQVLVRSVSLSVTFSDGHLEAASPPPLAALTSGESDAEVAALASGESDAETAASDSLQNADRSGGEGGGFGDGRCFGHRRRREEFEVRIIFGLFGEDSVQDWSLQVLGGLSKLRFQIPGLSLFLFIDSFLIFNCLFANEECLMPGLLF